MYFVQLLQVFNLADCLPYRRFRIYRETLSRFRAPTPFTYGEFAITPLNVSLADVIIAGLSNSGR
ncbi:hypothetical protein P4233_11730, partial [Pseudomonas aeruginosa]|nr:hypothetical protein [Pseudomonas aeruginosa]